MIDSMPEEQEQEKHETQLRVQNYFLGAVLLVTFYLVFLVFRPYIAALVLAIVLVVIFFPLRQYLRKLVRSEIAAALLSTFCVFVVILVPISFFGWVALHEFTSFVSTGQASAFIHHISFLNASGANVQSYVQNFIGGIFNNIGGVLSNLLALFAFVGITLITIFFFFKDGPSLRDAVLEALPLSANRTKKLTEDMHVGIRAVIGGYVLIAVIQGAVSGIGFWIFGLDQPALWAAVVVVFALIPSFGASIIYATAIITLLAQQHTGGAIGLTIWACIALIVVDNFIGPRFIAERSKINIVLVLFSILGGLRLFGPAGFVVGPTIIILFWSVLGMFQESGMLPGTNPVTTEKLKEKQQGRKV
jgi:predicted PurR-regulated permease PerM